MMNPQYMLSTVQQQETNKSPRGEGLPTGLSRAVTDVQEPLDMDILWGNNITKRTANHPGNVVFREMIEKCVDIYNKAQTKQKKIKVIRQIIEDMRQKHGARFLSKKGQGWVIMGDHSIRDTISRTLRSGGQTKQRLRTAGTGQEEDYEKDPVLKLHVGRVRDSQLRILESMLSEDPTHKGLATQLL